MVKGRTEPNTLAKLYDIENQGHTPDILDNIRHYRRFSNGQKEKTQKTEE